MGIKERREREKEQRKQEITDAAEKVFFSMGIEKATMQHVADTAELSKGTLYLYFKSKEDLHYALNLRGMRVLREIMETHYNEEADGFDNVINMGRAYLEFYNSYPNYFESIIHFESSKLATVSKENQRQIISKASPLVYLIEILDQGKKDGSIRKDQPSHLLATILWSQLTGLQQFIHNRQDIIELLDISSMQLFSSHFDILRAGIKRS